MKKLLLKNTHGFHWEIIESVIVKYAEILQLDSKTVLDIYLNVAHNDSFKKYISAKYPHVKFENIGDYDYFINCTVYDKDITKLDSKLSNKKYIAHEITTRLQLNPNVYFLTPLSGNRFIYADVLPLMEQKKESNIPIYIIQGHLNGGRRNLNLLKKILDNDYQYDFKIKLLGRGAYPKEMVKYKNKILLKNNLNFMDYHKEFLDGYCILPLISKETHAQYYSCKLTSTINYARAYKLKSLIDKDLQDIYNLENAYVYNNINDIVLLFEKSLESFYNMKKSN